MSFLDKNLPSVFDRADGGLTTGFGSPIVKGAVGVNYPGGSATGFIPGSPGYPDASGGLLFVEEASDSPTVEFGEQCTITHRFFMDRYTMILFQSEYARGYILEDNSGNISRVLSTNSNPVAKTGGLVYQFTMVSEAQSFSNPPNEFDVQPIELNPVAEKHPRYSGMTYFQKDIVRTATVADYIDVKQQYKNIVSTFSGSSQGVKAVFTNQQGEAYELLYKKQKGEETFYLSGYKIIFSAYYWQPQIINPGGYFENPFNVIPYQYFTTGNGQNIFQNNATYNANLYPNPAGSGLTVYPYGLSWLRQTDIQTLNRTWYKVTETWIGAPLGHWDNEWYNPLLQPLQTASYSGNLNLI